MFEPVTIQWSGKTYRIEPPQIMRAIAVIEDVVTLEELHKFYQRNSAPLGKLSMAFGALLRFMGAQVTDEEIYSAMFKSDQANSEVSNAIIVLLNLMIPKNIEPKGNEKQVPTKADKSSSKKSTKHLSA